jgi:uncharacterized protein YecE (DUF72 family)
VDTRPIRSLSGEEILEDSVYQRMLEARERKPDLPVISERTASFVFLRYIGHPEIDGNKPYFAEWADHLAEWIREGAEAYVFCHCPDERVDPWMCRAFHQRVSVKVDIPPLPWDEPGSDSAWQERLF